MYYNTPRFYKIFNIVHFILFIFISILLFDFINILDPWEGGLKRILLIAPYISLGIGIFNLFQFLFIIGVLSGTQHVILKDDLTLKCILTGSITTKIL